MRDLVLCLCSVGSSVQFITVTQILDTGNNQQRTYGPISFICLPSPAPFPAFYLTYSRLEVANSLCCYGALFPLTQTQNCTSLSAFSRSLGIVFKCSRASLSRPVLWIMNIFSYVSVVSVAVKTCLEICWKKNVNVPFWTRLTCFSSSSPPLNILNTGRSESFLIWRPRRPLWPRT